MIQREVPLGRLYSGSYIDTILTNVADAFPKQLCVASAWHMTLLSEETEKKASKVDDVQN